MLTKRNEKFSKIFIKKTPIKPQKLYENNKISENRVVLYKKTKEIYKNGYFLIEISKILNLENLIYIIAYPLVNNGKKYSTKLKFDQEILKNANTEFYEKIINSIKIIGNSIILSNLQKRNQSVIF